MVNFVPPCVPIPPAWLLAAPVHGTGRGIHRRGPPVRRADLLRPRPARHRRMRRPAGRAAAVVRGRAARKLSVLVLNVCAGRLQTSCTVTPEGGGCSSTTVGDLLGEIADLIRAGDCRRPGGARDPARLKGVSFAPPQPRTQAFRGGRLRSEGRRAPCAECRRAPPARRRRTTRSDRDGDPIRARPCPVTRRPGWRRPPGRPDADRGQRVPSRARAWSPCAGSRARSSPSRSGSAGSCARSATWRRRDRSRAAEPARNAGERVGLAQEIIIALLQLIDGHPFGRTRTCAPSNRGQK